MASCSTASDGSCGAKAADFRRASGPTRRSTKAGWTDEEDELLTRVVKELQGKNWKRVAEFFPGRTDVQCLHRWQKVLNPELIKGSWTKEEDDRIVHLVQKLGSKKWSVIARYLPGRIGKQCRERWHNHLNPTIRKDAWTMEEEAALIRTHKVYGNRWAEIAKVLPGRSDNSIKNHWNCSLRKRLDSFLASGVLDEPCGLAALREECPKVESVKHGIKDLMMADQKQISEHCIITATASHEKATPGVRDLSFSCILSGYSGGMEVQSRHYRGHDFTKRLKLDVQPLLRVDSECTELQALVAEDLECPRLEARDCKKPLILLQDGSPFACHCTSLWGKNFRHERSEAFNCTSKSWHGDDSDHTFSSNDSSCTSVLRPLEQASTGIPIRMPFGCFDQSTIKASQKSQDCGVASAHLLRPQLIDSSGSISSGQVAESEGKVQPAENQNHIFTPPNLPPIASFNLTTQKSVMGNASKSTVCPIAYLRKLAETFKPMPNIISRRGCQSDKVNAGSYLTEGASIISAGRRLESEFDKEWDSSGAAAMELNASRIP